MRITHAVEWTPAQLRALTPICGHNPVRPVDSIVLHHTAPSDRPGPDPDETPQGIHEHHYRIGYGGCGYHYLITPQLAVWRGRPLWARGAHARNNNSGRIGIALLGNYDATPPDPRMTKLALALIEDLRSLYGPLPVLPHRALNSTRCPGDALMRQYEALGGTWGEAPR